MSIGFAAWIAFALAVQSDGPVPREEAPEPFVRSMCFGIAITVLDDLDGDGKREFMVADAGAIHLGEPRGAVVTYDGRSLKPRACEWGSLKLACFSLVDTRSTATGSLFFATSEYVEPTTGAARHESDTSLVRVRRLGADLVTVSMPGSNACSIITGADLDRDGIGDVLVAQPQARGKPDWNGRSNSRGRVDLYSGKTGGRIAESPALKGVIHFGASVAVLDDLDGDGVRDLAISSEDRVTFHSGTSLGRLADVPELKTTTWYGATLSNVRDCDRDGATELLIGNSETKDASVVRLWSVKKSRELWHDELPGLPADSGRVLRFDFVQLDDIDGDGVDDIAYAVDDPESRSTYPSTVRALSGASGKVLWSTTFQETSGDFLGLRLCAWSDHNSDGHGDLLLGKREWRYGAEETSPPGSVSVLDGVTGKMLARVE